MAKEFHGTGVRINIVEPRAAVMSEGATASIGRHRPTRSDRVDGTDGRSNHRLCDCPVDLTGRCCVSLDLIDELSLTVLSLDGRPIN